MNDHRPKATAAKIAQETHAHLTQQGIKAANQGAYTRNGCPVDAATFYALACDPLRTVAVEACAGAGKTWILVSRMLRALLAGIAPESILAITFTKRAAGEMRTRLQQWLDQFALEPDDSVLAQELVNRGVPAKDAPALLPQLRALRERLLSQSRGVEITTFHSWFSKLLTAAPLGVLSEFGLPTRYELVEDDSELFDAAWYSLLRQCLTDAELKADMQALVQSLGAFSAREALKAAWQRRVEFALADAHGVVERSVASAADPAPEIFKEAFVQRWLTYAKVLGQEKNKTPQKAAVAIVDAMMCQDAAKRLDGLRDALLTKTANTLKNNLQKFTIACQAELELQALLQQGRQYGAWCYQQCMTRLLRALLACYAQVKREQGKIDMLDLERVALRLLGDTETYGWVAERLDARVSQVLIDEFQDTNPLQWQALQGWLAAYGGAGGGGRLSVFIVGDPKQSIYRFRRADPAVFGAACDFLRDTLGGDHLACDHTRRNAPEVVAVVNTIFEQAQQAGEYSGFRPHTTAAMQTGIVACLPQVLRDRAPAEHNADGKKPLLWRDSLTIPRFNEEEKWRMHEARQAAALIAHWITGEHWEASDIKVLARKRERLRELTAELNRRGVPWFFADDVALMQTQEVQDIVALLDVLASPMHDLSLAQVLRSPVFALGEPDMMLLAAKVQARRERTQITSRNLQSYSAQNAATRKSTKKETVDDEISADQGPEGSSDRIDRADTCVSWWSVLQLAAKDEADTDWSPALRDAAQRLANWRQLVQMLPPHDALDAIYHEGDVLARYAQAVPAAMRDEVLGNLKALLQQALALDGGRFATPYNFVRAMRNRAVGSVRTQSNDAVELLTIHGAKGLEARGVVVLDTDSVRTRGDNLSVLMEWPAHEPYPNRFIFFINNKALPPDAQQLAEREAAAEAREELNALYVAMTRARDRLVFSSLQSSRKEGSVSTWWNRAHVLHDTGLVHALDAFMSSTATPASTEPQEDSEIIQRVLPAYDPPQYLRKSVAVSAMTLWETQESLPGISRAAQQGEPSQDTQAQRFGMALHRLLEWGRMTPEHVQAVAQEFALPLPQAQEAALRATSIMEHAQSRRFFDSKAFEYAENEAAFWFEGKVLRFDRLVKMDGHWWILDYKSAFMPMQHHKEAYQVQMALYKQALQAVYPGEPVHAVLISGSGETIEL